MCTCQPGKNQRVKVYDFHQDPGLAAAAASAGEPHTFDEIGLGNGSALPELGLAHVFGVCLALRWSVLEGDTSQRPFGVVTGC
jgi:hypothetical protein